MPTHREFTLRIHVDGRRVAWSTGDWRPEDGAARGTQAAMEFRRERKAGRAGVIRLQRFDELGMVLEAIGNDVAPIRRSRGVPQHRVGVR